MMHHQSPMSQDMPLAPATYRTASDDQEQSMAMKLKEKKLPRRKCMIQCCGCVTALLLILAVILLVLMFTIFQVKAPVLKMNSINIQNFELENGTLRSGSRANITLIAYVSVKNKNYASFKFDNATTIVYYHGARVGGAMSPPGHAKKRSTLKMNVTIDVIPDKMLAVPSLSFDLSSGALNLNSYTRISGRIKVIRTFQKLVVVNCTMTVNVTTRAIQGQNCNPYVAL